MSKTVNW